MALVISFDEEMQHPRTLFVMESPEDIAVHAEMFCSTRGLEYNPKSMQAAREAEGRTYRWIWTWPREIYSTMRGAGPHRWVWQHSGRQFSHIELHTCIPPEDLNYLIGRMRGMPLENKAGKEEQ